MTAITHHIPEAMLAAYAAGSLPRPFALVVAAHVSACDECRAVLAAHQAVGGAVLDAQDCIDLSSDMKAHLFARLDRPYTPEPEVKRAGVFPAAVMEALKGRPPRWKALGAGVKQDILSAGKAGSVRLLYIPAGQAVPDHGHGGLEMTLVLQGSFSDQTGRFVPGDVEIADQELDHTPVADRGDDCICLAATDASLRFRSFIPRLLQPMFRI
jgi:putative transcriptional regulator